MATERKSYRLTPRQLLFAEARAAGKSNTDAALLAGYAPSSATEQAHRIAILPHVQAEIDNRLRERAEFTELSVDSWKREVSEYLRDAKIAEDLSNRGRALELAGRHLGALDPQTPQQTAAAQILAQLFARALEQHALPQQQPADITANVTVTDSSAEISGANGAGEGQGTG